MNFTPTFGWYYRGLNDRAPAWTGVEFFYRFLINNAVGVGAGNGPYAEEVSVRELEIGDFVQLGDSEGRFYHTPVVVGFSGRVPLVAAHTYDVYNKPLSGYVFSRLRCLHIVGIRE